MSNATAATRNTTGGCLCKAVRYEVNGELRDVVLCHCEMCRRTHGHVAAYTAAQRDEFRLVESRGLRWYASSAIARRAFCAECGASLFWEREGGEMISIAAGSVDAPTGLKTSLQIFVDSAGDYYEIDDRIAQRRE